MIASRATCLVVALAAAATTAVVVWQARPCDPPVLSQDTSIRADGPRLACDPWARRCDPVDDDPFGHEAQLSLRLDATSGENLGIQRIIQRADRTMDAVAKLGRQP